MIYLRHFLLTGEGTLEGRGVIVASNARFNLSQLLLIRVSPKERKEPTLSPLPHRTE